MRNARRWFVGAAVVAMLGGGAGAALAQGNPSGSNPPNTHGLCTAASNGQKNGGPWTGDNVPPPFQALAAQGESEETSQTPNDARSDVILACQNANVPIGGQQNGSPGSS